MQLTMLVVVKAEPIQSLCLMIKWGIEIVEYVFVREIERIHLAESLLPIRMVNKGDAVLHRRRLPNAAGQRPNRKPTSKLVRRRLSASSEGACASCEYPGKACPIQEETC